MCSCRASRAKLGEGCGDDAESWCIGVGDMADYIVETQRGEYITKDEALEIFKKAEDNGFVHQITNIDGEQKIFGICNCNVNVCNALRTSQLFNTPNLSRSAYVASVESESCVACGRCVENCPAGAVKLGQKLCTKNGYIEYPRQELPDDVKWGPEKWSVDYRDRNRINCYNTGTSPCKTACPAHIAVQGYLKLAAQGKYREALQLIKRENPFPAVCGRICNRRCEDACTRGTVDQAVAIDEVKRFIAQQDLNAETRFVPEKVIPKVDGEFSEKIAVIGGGPSGLSAAYYLALMGHKVTVYEKCAKLGGMLRYGIPSYRLPRERLQAEIDWILSAGIDVELDHSVNGEELARLRDEFDAVYLAIGAHSDKKLGLPGEEAPGVESAVKMLRAIGDDELPDLSGQRVCVIGGGNVAMDVARSAVRCGAEKVSIVYRRRICDMTAQDAEIAGAQAEGCEVLELTAPLAIETGEDGRVSGLRVQPQIIGEPRRGRPAPRAAATPERVIPCERVFVAIGQDIDSKPFEDMGIACKWGCVVTDSDGAVPNFDGLFSGGDCQTGPATVIRAINAGRVASANIDRYLGFDHKIKLDVELPTVQFKGKHECGRCELGEREAGERIHDWNLVEQGLTEEEARQEASRCLRCDHFGFGAFRGGRNLEW